jgi:exo beta-1,2-glucooligosaccharide sophorohydrolase (non-reducing end)
LLFVVPTLMQGQSSYFPQTFFDNSLTSDSYYYSAGKASTPSTLELLGGKLPVETGHFRTPPNALRLRWKSMGQGGWSTEIRLYQWRNREINFPGDTLVFSCYAPEAIRPEDFPRLALKDKDNNFTQPLNISNFVQGVGARQWTEVRVPLDRFVTASIHPFEPRRMNSIFFVQGEADRQDHTLIVDEFRTAARELPSARPALPVVRHIQAKGYERHVDVSWDLIEDKSIARYVIYRSLDGRTFSPIGIQLPGVCRYSDFLGKPGQQVAYKVVTSDVSYRESALSEAASASTRAMSDDELLTAVQEACFRYYWEGADPHSGMTRENFPGDDRIVATGASGFGIMALVVGVHRGFITREQGLQRMRQIADFLGKADRFHGVWPHFMNGETGHRMPVFGVYENGADLVETAFLLEGLLSARQYFKGSTPAEQELDKEITHLWESVEWDWFRRMPDGDALYWHWSPEYSWHINHRLTGWNEVMITYLLAIASPTHGVPASLYYTGWAGQSKAAIEYRQSWGQSAAGDHYTNGKTYEGIKLDVGVGSGGPLFFTHYSFMGFDPHMRDRFTNYFDNNRSQVRINRAYCIRNPGHFPGYGENCWGITAVDGPEGYVPYEPNPKMDDGTIAPTGAIASFPYTPEASMKALKYFYREIGDRLWGIYGFRDAFNLKQNWFSNIYMGLNQAPMVVMIENYRTGLVWKNFMANPEMQPMMQHIGFQPEPSRRFSR